MIRSMVRCAHVRGRSHYSSVATATAATNKGASGRLDEFRTLETNTDRHGPSTLARFYTIATEERKQIFTYGGLPKSYERQIKTFNECCLMVRRPAVEIIELLRATDFSRPVNRFVLYGEDGAGKSLTLAHLLHYGYQQQYVLVHVPWLPNWLKRPKETANANSVEGALDLPLDGAAWLVHFKNQNGALLERLGLTVSRDYVWTKRETTPEGAPLMALVEHGISRAKFSCDAIAALVRELKQHSTAGRARTMVVIDGYNALFHPHTRILTENKVRLTPDRITLAQPFREITRNDWTNGVCILAVDRLALTEDRMASTLPLYLLYREGFEHLDPFVPIRVDGYDETEFHSCVQYYLDRKWIQTTEPGFDVELKALSCKNPYQLMQLCASL
ncbi:28S ribosomal protein S29, mitochondrial-like [Anopheles albimanus]|uniref:Small ribosomal subunit protein mS29 n=1 Tax=Anopheles albimanus TaxID=7167 RepID=A0A182FII6_ANOAL|nr:28S ribosomal protein S29, mitochondrial-like [Anopheles albimanus]